MSKKKRIPFAALSPEEKAKRRKEEARLLAEEIAKLKRKRAAS